MQATWHEAPDAGSMRFSTNLRDSSYREASYARRDRPFWLPEPIARELLDEMDWPDWAIYASAASLIVMCLFVIKELQECMRGWQRDRATRLLLQEERQAKAEAQPSVQAVDAGDAPALAPGRVRIRFCRYCDVAIDDEFVEKHTEGKRHRKLEAAAGALRSEGSCWVWRIGDASATCAPVRAPQNQTPSTAQAEVPTNDDFDDPRLAPPSQVRSGGGGDGGKGKWAAAKPTKRRR